MKWPLKPNKDHIKFFEELNDDEKGIKESDEMNILGKAKALLKRLSKEPERGLLKRSLKEDEKGLLKKLVKARPEIEKTERELEREKDKEERIS
jgi:hypothetical protein